MRTDATMHPDNLICECFAAQWHEPCPATILVEYAAPELAHFPAISRTRIVNQKEVKRLRAAKHAFESHQYIPLPPTVAITGSPCGDGNAWSVLLRVNGRRHTKSIAKPLGYLNGHYQPWNSEISAPNVSVRSRISFCRSSAVRFFRFFLHSSHSGNPRSFMR